MNNFNNNLVKNENEFEIRPTNLDDFIGQENLIKIIKISIESSKYRGDFLEHILLYGPPGVGKTTLAYIVASKIGSRILTTSGPSLKRVGDLVSLLTSLHDNDILFIDEIHRLPKVLEEILYSAMEDRFVDIIYGKDEVSSALHINLENFTLIGATTKLGSISSPLRDRFGLVFGLSLYNTSELERIIDRSSKIYNIEIDIDARKKIALASRGTPRICNKLFRRCRDYCLYLNTNRITLDNVLDCFKLLGISIDGLNQDDINYLKTILNIYNGGPVGINTLSKTMGIDIEQIEEVIEPFLLNNGYIIRTSKGRIISKKGITFLGKENEN